MKKMLKIAGVGGVVVILFLGTIYALAKVFITPERVRETVLPLAKEALHREVRFGNIEIRLFSGIVLEDLVIAERDGGGEPFVAADRVRLRYLFWPLLLKKVVVDEVRLDAPRIRIVRHGDGSFNFSDLTEIKPEPDREPTEKPAPPGGIDLLVSEVVISGGDIVFTDETVQPGTALVTVLKRFSLTADDISLDRAIPVAVKAELNSTPVELRGKIDSEKRSIDMLVKAQGLDVAAFSPYFKEKLPGRLGTMKVTADLAFSAEGSRLTSKGSLSLDEVDLILDAMPESPFQKASLSLAHDLLIDMEADHLLINAADIRFNGVPVKVAGKVDSLRRGANLDLSLSVADMDIAKALAALPEKLAAPAHDFSLAGKVSAEVRLSGPVSEPTTLLKGGEAHLAGLEATVRGVRSALDGALSLKGDELTLKDVVIRIGEDRVTVSGRAFKLRAKPFEPELDLRVAAEKLDLRAMSASLSKDLGAGIGEYAPSGTASLDLQLAGPVNEPLKLLKGGKARLADVEATVRGVRPRVNGSLSLNDGVLAMEGFQIKLGDSLITVTGSMRKLLAEPFNPVLEADIVAPGINLASLTASLPADAKEGIAAWKPAGEVSMNLKLSGPVKEPLKMLHSGQATLSGVEATVGGLRPLLNGSLTLSGGTLSCKGLSAKVGDETALVDLTANNLGGRPIRVTHSVTSSRFRVDSFLGKADKGEAPKKPEVENKGESDPAREPGPLDLPLIVDGAVRIDQALYKKMVIDTFELRYRLADNVVTIDKMLGRAAGGDFNNTGRLDLAKKGFAYSGDIGVRRMQADQFVDAFLPKMEGTIFGTMDLKMALNGAGTLPEEAKRNLKGRGELLITDGRLTGAGFAQGFAAFLDLEQLRVLRFSELRSTLNIENGKVMIDSDVSGSDVRMAPRGTIGLDGTVDMTLDTRISPAQSSRLSSGRIGQFLTDEQGWAQLPLKVSGLLASPRFVLDTALVTEKLREKAKETIQQKLQEKLFDKIAPSRQATPPPQESPSRPAPEAPKKDPAKQLLEDAFKGIFGR